jgi:hypothetical protein
MKSTCYEASHYAVSSSLLLLPPSAQHPVLRHSQLRPFLRMGDRVSQPYKITDKKTMILNILSLEFCGFKYSG